MKLVQWSRQKIADLREIKDGPHRIALGAAIGTSIGFLPPIGLKTLLAMGISRICRGNVIAAAIGVTLHGLLLPLAPAILVAEYKIGVWLLRGSAGSSNPPEPIDWRHPTLAALWRIELPMLIGGTILGIPFGLAGYFLTRKFLARVLIPPAP